jgi:iron-regulated transporter 1
MWVLESPSLTDSLRLLHRIFASSSLWTSPTFLSLVLFTFLSLSRLGIWVFDLTTQQLTQTFVSTEQRSSFAGVENSFISFFELCHYIGVISLSKPSQFKWLATASWVAEGVSTAMYAGWVRRQRGHLVHWEKVTKGCECVATRNRVGEFGRRASDSIRRIMTGR